MECEEIRKYFQEYSNDKEHQKWIEIEERVGKKIREQKKPFYEDVVIIAVWKFLGTQARPYIMRIIEEDPKKVEKIIHRVFTGELDERQKIELLTQSKNKIKGVGVALVSAILTFFDPQNYGVIDENVWRAVFGEGGKRSFTVEEYIHLLERLRKDAKKCGMRVRDVERAYYQKGLKTKSS